MDLIKITETKLFLLIFYLSLSIDGTAQIGKENLEDRIELELEIILSDKCLYKRHLSMKACLKNKTNTSIYILKNSCYELERFFKFQAKDVVIVSRIGCEFSYPTTQMLGPKESFQFEVDLWMLNGLPNKEFNIGLELIEVPEEHVAENMLFLSDEKRDEFETFTFWKTVEEGSFRIDIPPLRL